MYRLLIQNNENSGEVVADFWRWFWKLDIPLKVGNFIWRLCSNIVSVLANLRRRYIDVEILCPVCNAAEETVLHHFVECPFDVGC